MLRRICLILMVLAVLAPAASRTAAGSVRLTLVLICDISDMSEKDGRGGLARVAAAVKAERARSKYVIVAHAGDAISPSLMSGMDSGAHMIDLLNLLPIDIFVPGNHEFDFGPETFVERMGAARFPVYAANLAGPNGQPLANVRSHVLIDFGEVRVGLIGLTAEDSVRKSSPGNLVFADSVATAERLALQLRREGADLIVVVAHADRQRDEALLASGGADILLSGGDHDLVLRYDGRRALAEAMQEGRYVVTVDIDVDLIETGGRRRVKWWPRFRVIDTADVAPDPDVAVRVALYERRLSKKFDVVIGRTETELDSRNAAVRGGEAAIGNLFADAIRAATGADLALLNGGGIRGNRLYPPGAEITRRHVLAELPFSNRTLVLSVSGAQLREALEQGLGRAESLTGAFPQVSGMIVRADLSRPEGQRVVSVEVGGKPLDPEQRYTLATNDFLARGGDGYSALQAGKRVVGPADAELTANHVMAYLNAKRVVAPKIEGRVIVARRGQPR